jgi:CHAD domain-containing protein
MSYRFQRKETVADAFRRVADEQFAALDAALRATPRADVHEARRRCKMLRALLRLFTAALDPPARRAADAGIAKIANALAPARDAEVRRQTFDALLRGAGPKARTRFAPVRTVLDAEAADGHHALPIRQREKVLAMSAALRPRVIALRLDRHGWRALAPGLRRASRRGRRAMAEARHDPAPERWHDWRKLAKRLWYDLRLLRNVRPRKLATPIAQLERLTEHLGDEHDLIVLRQHIEAQTAAAMPAGLAKEFIAFIDRRRALHRRGAERLGRKVFSEKPADFVARLERSWRAWRK